MQDKKEGQLKQLPSRVEPQAFAIGNPGLGITAFTDIPRGPAHYTPGVEPGPNHFVVNP